MRRSFCLGLLGLAVSAFAAEPPPKNLIENGNLEAPVAKDGLPTGWIRYQKPENAYHFSVTGGGRTGKALLIDGTGEYGAVIAGRTTVRPGQRYYARAWMRVEGEPDTTATFRFDYYDAANGYLASTYAGPVTTEIAGWQPVALEDHLSGFSGVRTVAVSVNLSGKGKAWFDDLELIARAGSGGSADLLTNGDMETVVGPRPVAWSLAEGTATEAALGWSAERPKDGWYCLSLRSGAERSVAEGQRVARQAGKTYVLKGYGRAKTGKLRLRLSFYNENGPAGEVTSDDVSSPDWAELAVTVPPSTFPTATQVAAAVVADAGAEGFADGLTLIAK